MGQQKAVTKSGVRGQTSGTRQQPGRRMNPMGGRVGQERRWGLGRQGRLSQEPWDQMAEKRASGAVLSNSIHKIK